MYRIAQRSRILVNYTNSKQTKINNIMKNFLEINRALAAKTTKLFTLLLAVAASIGTILASTKIGNLYYNLDATNKTAEVTSQPSGSYGGSITIPASVEYNSVTYSVTSIGGAAFWDCRRLTSVTIPNSVTSIGGSAFYGCSGLTSPVYNAHVFAYMPTSYSGAYTIPEGIESIAGGAFDGCTGLTSVTIPNSVTSIGDYAFWGCSGLTSVTIPNSVTSIGYEAFYGCSGLTSVTIPNSVISIGRYAFYKCTGLTSVTIPNSVTSIGGGAFYGCSGLTSIEIPNSVTSIEWGAFASCTGLTSVTIGNSVTSIGDDAFLNCNSLTSIYATCGDLERVKLLFNNDSRVKYAPLKYSITCNVNIEGAGSVQVPQNECEDVITAIPNYGYNFTRWSDGVTRNPRTVELTQDTTFTAEFAIDKSGTCGENNALMWTYDDISKTLTISGSGALTTNYTYGVEAPTQMKTLIIGNEVTAIGDSAFYKMSSINHLIIGGSVASIGDYAFAECRNFDDITCYAQDVPAINANTFANVGNKRYIYLYVPEDRERAYKRDTYWGEFDVQVKGAAGTTTDQNVTVIPYENSAVVTWPTENNAATYTLQITKDGVVFCTLIFNSNGQLTGIAFAPGRNGASHAPAATMSVAGMSFTVTGLDGASKYAYNLSVADDNNQELVYYQGEFATTGYEGEVVPGGEPVTPGGGTTAIDNVNPSTQSVGTTKFFRNGQLFIQRGNELFNAQGARVE